MPKTLATRPSATGGHARVVTTAGDSHRLPEALSGNRVLALG